MGFLFDIAAVVGAGAWIPQILRFFSKPVLKFLPAPTLEIGYTGLGPILNLNLAISTNKKDALIERLELDVIHSTGTKRDFVWQFTSEIPFETQGPSGDIQLFMKNQTATALKIPVAVLIDKKIGFQSATFLKEKLELVNKIQEKEEHFKRTQGETNLPNLIFKEQEWTTLENFFTNNFYWTDGTYDIVLRAFESSLKEPHTEKYMFSLSLVQKQILQRNIEITVLSMKDTFNIFYHKPLLLTKPIWNWVNPTIARTK